MSQRRYRPKRSLPPGMTLIELLVVMAIIGVLASLMVVSVQKAIVVAMTLKCTAQLRNLGLAMHMYQDTRGYYPCEAESQESFYLCLLDYVDAGHQRDAVRKGGASAAEPVRAFLCPGRRDVMVGAKGDYGYGSSPGSGLSSILGSQTPVSSTMVSAADGSGNTLLLSHKGLSPRDYGGNGAKDTSWAVAAENSRDPTRFVKDTDQEDMSKLIGAPHIVAAPSLFADTSVRKVLYESSSTQIGGQPLMSLLWSYNDGKGLGRHVP